MARPLAPWIVSPPRCASGASSQAEVHALATQARASAGVLGIAPVVFTALVSAIEPGTVRFLTTTPVGLLCLVAGLVLEAAGALWMGRIVAGAA